jgi:hypothetical protein
MSAVGTWQEEPARGASYWLGEQHLIAAAAAGILMGAGHAGAIYSATGPERPPMPLRDVLAGALKSLSA